MNQRFQNAEIKLVSEQYSENELYRAICQIGQQLESELKEFGLCPEECFMETLELLSDIAEKGEDFLPDIENYWLRKHNEYRRFDRRVSEEEICKAVGMVFGFSILAVDSSQHRFYRYTLTSLLTQTIASHKFDDWEETLDKIFSLPLPDGWFDDFINQEPDDGGEMADFAEGVASLHKQMPYTNLIIQFVQKQYNSSCQQFMGKMENPSFITPQRDEAV